MNRNKSGKNRRRAGRTGKRLPVLGVLAILAVIITAAVPGGSQAEELTIPEESRIIGEEAFAGCTGIRSVYLPEGVEEIRERAFAETEIYTVEMPESVESIAADAFDGVTTPLLIRTLPGTEAVSFAMANRIDFEAETVRRALLIAQENYPYPNSLSGPGKDLTRMKTTLSDIFEVTIRKDLTAAQIPEEIAATFSGATEEDISLFYYSGHGNLSNDPETNGALVGIEYNQLVTAAQLRSALDRIPGRKIVIIDACYSGALIGRSTMLRAKSAGEENAANAGGQEAPAVSFMAAFTKPRLRGRSLAVQPYYVMVSSTGAEISWENNSGGFFTGAFTESRSMGDANGDGIVTMLESYNYSRNKVNTVAAADHVEQSVQVYPENCYWFGLFR